ncbi:MAG: hypothetical protein ABT20_01810 [Rubrivivax sp. SCN 70-15]|mgnify:CR=1 FL=1|nr:MAG: hypothetical protein ABT20_01810 [Rubrivivax sp. SCN 70-15]
MILSHRYRFIFFAIPKTGTHAIRFALRPHLGEEDLEQVQLFARKHLPYADLARIGHGHLGWRETKAALPAQIWDSYVKFAIVRNPWERFVSYCAFMHRATGLFAADPRAAMNRVLDNPEHRMHVVFRPQHEFICAENGRLMIDLVGRHEAMQSAFDGICERLGLPTQVLERVNASAHGPWRDYYDASLRARVAGVYARDIEIFSYHFDD